MIRQVKVLYWCIKAKKVNLTTHFSRNMDLKDADEFLNDVDALNALPAITRGDLTVEQAQDFLDEIEEIEINDEKALLSTTTN